ncbi:phosphinothricin acetyltransferase [Haladaptatus litoreus]|uniref:Phosphinothricin acetyltransferase n=1 Tax=Haladaptatus litoreus TaxID=553468 RepID=A0A1N6X918_9EURY|nr:arsinothricin resistance N-acetyltransferase ArsN1 family B [Haladaptatus litoreus]SIQ98803.1 phosphinothricin acetyltransferase [Haladaptatus litoreus]
MPTIRLAEVDDARQITAIYAPIVRDTIISFETNPPDEKEMASRIRKTLPNYPWLVCEHEGEICGYAYATTHRTREAYQWSVDVSVYVHDSHRRCGIGRGLYESLFALLREQGFYNAYAGIALPNPASVTLHESLGFEPVGTYEAVGYKHGAWHDVGWWHLQLGSTEEKAERPEPPSALTEIDTDDEIERGMDSIRIS